MAERIGIAWCDSHGKKDRRSMARRRTVLIPARDRASASTESAIRVTASVYRLRFSRNKFN